MATKAAALYGFMSQFGIPAYTASSVPESAEFPYLTYELSLGAFGDGETGITVNLWYRGESESPANAKADEISKAIGSGGRIVQCEGGAIWIKRGTPFCQSVYDTDNTIKRRYINISAEFFTVD